MELNNCDITVLSSGLLVKPQSKIQFTELLDNLEAIALQALALGLKEAKLFDLTTKRWISIPVKMISGNNDENAPAPQVTPMVFGANLGFDAQDLRILARIQESEKPMSLVGLEGADEDKQKWVNRALLQMLRRPEEWATSLDLKTLWDADNLEDLKNQLRQQSLVDLNNYRAYLPYAPGVFTATFEVVHFSLYPKMPKVPMRLVTTHSYEPLERTTPAWV